MSTLFRLVAMNLLVYVALLIAFPRWQAPVYHVASVSVILGGCVGLWLLIEAVELGSTMAKIALELGFVAAVVFYFGTTMPQKSGLTPWEEWKHGYRPTRTEARDGLARLGIDPNSKAGSWVVNLFPKHS